MAILKKLDNLVDKYKDWQVKRDERRRQRHERNMEKLLMKEKEEELKLKIQTSKEKIQKSRIEIQKERLEVQEKKQKNIEGMPSLFGNFNSNKYEKLPPPPAPKL